MNAISTKQPEAASIAYFIIHRDDAGYAEIGVDAIGNMFIRHSYEGIQKALVPLGKCTNENIEQITDRLKDLSFFFGEA